MESLVRSFIVATIAFIIFSFLITFSAFAGSGLVSSIGGATFIQGAKHFYVSSARPAFSGITIASGTVDITINDTKNGVTADASGDWSYTPAADLSGDNEIVVADTSTSASFTLTIGALPESIASAAGSTLAPAGSLNPTLVFGGFGILLFLTGVFGLKYSSK